MSWIKRTTKPVSEPKSGLEFTSDVEIAHMVELYKDQYPHGLFADEYKGWKREQNRRASVSHDNSARGFASISMTLDDIEYFQHWFSKRIEQYIKLACEEDAAHWKESAAKDRSFEHYAKTSEKAVYWITNPLNQRRVGQTTFDRMHATLCEELIADPRRLGRWLYNATQGEYDSSGPSSDMEESGCLYRSLGKIINRIYNAMEDDQDATNFHELLENTDKHLRHLFEIDRLGR